MQWYTMPEVTRTHDTENTWFSTVADQPRGKKNGEEIMYQMGFQAAD